LGSGKGKVECLLVCYNGYHIAFSDMAQLTRGVVHGSGAVECGFRGRWLSPWLSLLLGSHGCLLGSCRGGSHLLGGCHHLAAGVVCSGGG